MAPWPRAKIIVMGFRARDDIDAWSTADGETGGGGGREKEWKERGGGGSVDGSLSKGAGERLGQSEASRASIKSANGNK